MQISKAGKSNNSGFTLIELIIVLFILAMMLGVVTPKVVSGLYGNSQRSVLRKMSGAISFARTQAMIQGKSWVIRLDLEKSRMLLAPLDQLKEKNKFLEQKEWKELEPLYIRDVQDEEGKIHSAEFFDIQFSPKGLARPTIIHLINDEDKPVQTLRLKPFNRKIKTYVGYVDYQDIFEKE